MMMYKPKRKGTMLMMVKPNHDSQADSDAEAAVDNNNNMARGGSLLARGQSLTNVLANYSSSSDDDTIDDEFSAKKDKAAAVNALPTLQKAISFGGLENLETGSVQSLSSDDDTIDSEYSAKKDGNINQEGERPPSDDAENITPPPLKPTLSFGSANNMRTGSLLHRAASLDETRGQADKVRREVGGARKSSVAALDAAVVAMEDDGSSTTATESLDTLGTLTTVSESASTFQYRPSQQKQPKAKSALKKSSFILPESTPAPAFATAAGAGFIPPVSTPAPASAAAAGGNLRLSKLSEQYDLDGDGVLDEVEQAMRDRDKDGDGQLDNAEVYRIVQDQLRSQQDVHLYKKVAAGLLCLVAILSLSNLGTSWASAILAKDTVADSESGTIQSKATGEVVGLQDVAFNYELDPLTEEEFEERRKLVEAEMMEDPDHEDHVHRRLGRKEKNHCSCSKIAYDHGKMSERDLFELTVKCDGVNSVSIKRKWRHNDGSEDVDYDTICGPGTVISRKGKKKKNKHKTKVKVMDEKVTFRKKGKNGRDKSISFDCKRGYCYGSGGAILQRAGHPCQLERDYDGAGECDEGLVCYNSDRDTYGVGVCTKLSNYSKKDQVCNIDYGVNACTANYACYSRKNGRNSKVKVGTVRTGNCQRVGQRSGYNEVCDVSFGANACLNDYRCLGANGRDIGRVGIGFCTRSEVTVNNGRDGGWYVDYSLGSQGQCVNDGNAETWENTWGTANACCEDKLSWMGRAQCVPGYSGWS